MTFVRFIAIFGLAGALALGALPCSFADFVDFADVDHHPRSRRFDSTDHNQYVSPNEGMPSGQRPVLEKAPQGVHVSVGTERGFFGAALNPGATHLLLIDRDPKVAFYNRINTALLAASRDRGDFFRLRYQASPREWATRAGDQSILKDPQAWKFWNATARASSPEFRALRDGGTPLFRGVRYFEDEAQYRKLSQMAKSGKIQSVVMDLGATGRVRDLFGQLQRKGIPLSVLDLSNAWWPIYIPPAVFEGTLEAARQAATPESVLMLAARGHYQKRGWFNTEATRYDWDYLGFRLTGADGLQNRLWELQNASPGGEWEDPMEPNLTHELAGRVNDSHDVERVESQRAEAELARTRAIQECSGYFGKL